MNEISTTSGHLGFPPDLLIGFLVLSIGAIIIDLYAHKKDEAISLKSAALWSIFWIAISLLFGLYIQFTHPGDYSKLFFAGYALEKVLSVDNLFVMMAIFSWFKVPEQYRHRVLYWGIIGAIVFRLIFVVIGSALMAASHYVEALFAVIIGWSAYKMMSQDDEDEPDEDFSEHAAYKFTHKIFPVWPRFFGHNFFLNEKELEQAQREQPDVKLELAGEDVKTHDQSHAKAFKKGTLVATPLLLCLVVIELTDVMFAFDSVPAVLAVSKEPLIVYSAMMFAILGLRTMYFVLEALKSMLAHLEKAVIILLYFIALKLLLSAFNIYDISANASLLVVLVVLGGGIAASFIWPDKLKESKGPQE